MAKKLNLTREEVIKECVLLIGEVGWDSVNVRMLAKKLNISTKPFYRLFTGMEEILDESYKYIYKLYDEFINKNIDNKQALVTLSVAHIEFAQKYKNFFISLFLSNNLKWNDMNAIFDEKWNQSTIINIVNRESKSFTDAKAIFMNIWLYTNGLATILATNCIKISNEEIIQNVTNVYNRFIN